MQHPGWKTGKRKGLVAMIGLTGYLLCGATAPQTCQTQSANIGPSEGQFVGAVVGVVAVLAVGTVVLIEVHHSHHTVKGCVSTGPNGVEVTTVEDKPKTYLLDGETASVKVGDLVRVHGDKIKKTKDATGDQVFRVQTLNRDYGPCPAAKKTP